MVVTESDVFLARGKLLAGDLGPGKGPWRARAEARPLGDYALRLALVHADGRAARLEDLPDVACRALEAQAARFPVVDATSADWWIVLTPGDGFFLRPGSREGGFDVFDVAPAEITERLGAIQRTRNLRRFAGSSFTAQWRDDLDVWVERRGERGDWERLARDAVLRPGESIRVFLQKKTDAIYDVNVFYLDANFGAHCLHGSPRLAAAAREPIDLSGEQTIIDDALGLENVLVFATPRTEASREVELCSVIEQRGVMRGAADDPFEQLIAEVTSGATLRSGPVRVADAGGTQSLLETLRTEWGALGPPPWPEEVATIERSARAAEASAGSLPDPWQAGSRAALASSGVDRRSDLLLLGDGEVEVVLVDFDPPESRAGVAAVVAARAFDAEVALQFGARRLAWYDRSDRGVLDLVLEDADGDGVAETRWTRAANAEGWQRDPGVALPWLSQSHVSPLSRGGRERVEVSRRLQALQRSR
jgi:hypothetical protein